MADDDAAAAAHGDGDRLSRGQTVRACGIPDLLVATTLRFARGASPRVGRRVGDRADGRKRGAVARSDDRDKRSPAPVAAVGDAASDELPLDALAAPNNSKTFAEVFAKASGWGEAIPASRSVPTARSPSGGKPSDKPDRPSTAISQRRYGSPSLAFQPHIIPLMTLPTLRWANLPEQSAHLMIPEGRRACRGRVCPLTGCLGPVTGTNRRRRGWR